MSDRTDLTRGLSHVAAMVRLHPRPFTVAVVGAAVFAGATVMSTVVLGWITDDVVLATFETGVVPDHALRNGAAAIVAVTILRVAGVVFRRFFAGMTAERVQATFRRQLSDQYLALPLAWHNTVPAGQLLAHADNDAEVAVDVLHPLPFSLGVGFLAVFSAISIIAVDPMLALIAFLIFPALTLLNRVYSRRIERPAADVQAGVGEVSSIAHESFDGALVVKTLGRAGEESERFAASVRQLQTDRVKVGYLRAAFESVMDVLPNLGIIVVLMVGIYRVQSGAVDPGDLVQVAALVHRAGVPDARHGVLPRERSSFDGRPRTARNGVRRAPPRAAAVLSTPARRPTVAHRERRVVPLPGRPTRPRRGRPRDPSR